MFQQSIFDSTPITLETPISLSLFTGNSLLHEGEMHTLMGTAKKPLPARITRVGDIVDCYRNLNKCNLFSIKQRAGALKGKVSGYARSVIIQNPTFAIGEKSRQTIVEKQSRNVHAYCRGSFVDSIDGDLKVNELNDYIRVSYSPYVSGNFYTLSRDSQGKLIKESIKPFIHPERYRYAIVNGADVILTNDCITQ